MKFTKSFPAKAMASENVPKSTTIRKMFTFSRCRISINTVMMEKVIRRMATLCASIHSGVQPMWCSTLLERSPLVMRK